MNDAQRAEALRLADLLDGKGNAMIPLPMDRIAALLRELAAVPAGWQPIETAPKNAYVMLWANIAVGPPLIVQGCWYTAEGEAGWVDNHGTIYRATHWMPLPAAPHTAR